MNVFQMYSQPPKTNGKGAEPSLSDNEKIKFLLEDFAKQQLIVDSAQEILEAKRLEIVAAFGDRKDNVSSENAVVAYKSGQRSFDWRQAALTAEIPTEKYKLYAKAPVIDWRKMCKNEGVLEEDVPFERRPGSVRVEIWRVEED